MDDLNSKIEAILFFKGEPVTVRFLAGHVSVSEGDVWAALNELEKKLLGRGIQMLRKDDTITLGTAPEYGALIEKLIKEELEKDLGKASLETLTIVLYRGPVLKSEIDYIRGVNSSFILRNLLIRGLIEREVNPEDNRSFLYRPTVDLLAYLGITKLEELPEYADVRGELGKFEADFKEENNTN